MKTKIHPAWIVAGITFGTLFATAGFRSAPSVLILPLEEDFGWRRDVISLAIAINVLLYGLTAPFAAALMERFTVRKVVIKNLPFLLSDTVGFIRKLPTQLVESFKSTLDEVREADLLIHVLDISHPNFEDQFRVVNETLAEIDNREKPTIVVFNKVDAYEYIQNDPDDLMAEETYTLDELRNTWMAKLPNTECVFLSATTKENLEEFKEIVYKQVKLIFQERYPYHNFLY